MTTDTESDGLDYVNGLAEADPDFRATSIAYHSLQAICAGLRRMRLRHDLSQAELGRALGVSQGRISQIESGLVAHAPSLDTVARYAAVCGEELDVSFSGEREAAPFGGFAASADPTAPWVLETDVSTGEMLVSSIGAVSVRDAVEFATRNHPADVQRLGGSRFRVQRHAALDVATAMVGVLSGKFEVP